MSPFYDTGSGLKLPTSKIYDVTKQRENENV